MSSSTKNPVGSLEQIERLFALMRSFRVGIVEIGDAKFVLEPETPQPNLRGQSVPELPAPKSIHDDPRLYDDGNVPTFDRH